MKMATARKFNIIRNGNGRKGLTGALLVDFTVRLDLKQQWLVARNANI
jgi:hypothetical protein